MPTRRDHWNEHARRFHYFGSPLRPVAADVRPAEAMVAEAAEGNGASPGRHALDALVLGVTPELVCMDWPRRTRVLSVDRNEAMIEGVWPWQRVGPRQRVVCGEWMSLPLDDASVDIVAGDGCYILVGGPAGQAALTEQVWRVLRRGGRFVVRHFVRPEQPEDLATVFADLEAGLIGSFHVFKWRLAMALHGSLEQGVRLADMWEAWHEMGPDPAALAERMNWPREAVATIDHYQDVATRYHFGTLAEIRQGFADHFEEVAFHVPDYELGERCPTFALRPR